MRGMRKWGATAVAVIAVAACGTAEADDAGAAGSEGYVRLINVEVAPLQAQEFVEEIRLTAVAVANQDVFVSAEENGPIREFYVDRGDRVEAGAPIAKLDDRVLAAQVEQARAGAELAQQTWERRRRLWEEDRAGSEIAYLEARYGAQQAAASLTALEERLAKTVVRAPFGGVVEERPVDVGAMMSPGEPIVRLVDLNPIKVFAGVPELYAADVHVGDVAQLSFDALGGEAQSARIRFVGATVNPQNRTFPIEIELPNPGSRIKPQMVANMAVARRSVTEAVVVPQESLVRVEQGYVVFVLAERDGIQVAERRDVTLGPARRNQVVIEDGVEAGEQLIVVGHRSVADGDRVNVVSTREGGT